MALAEIIQKNFSEKLYKVAEDFQQFRQTYSDACRENLRSTWLNSHESFLNEAKTALRIGELLGVKDYEALKSNVYGFINIMWAGAAGFETAEKLLEEEAEEDLETTGIIQACMNIEQYIEETAIKQAEPAEKRKYTGRTKPAKKTKRNYTGRAKKQAHAKNNYGEFTIDELIRIGECGGLGSYGKAYLYNRISGSRAIVPGRKDPENAHRKLYMLTHGNAHVFFKNISEKPTPDEIMMMEDRLASYKPARTYARPRAEKPKKPAKNNPGNPAPEEPKIPTSKTLTFREREIFKMLNEGKTAVDVSKVFVVSEERAEELVAKVKRKTGS
jgi:hypothetical protein